MKFPFVQYIINGITLCTIWVISIYVKYYLYRARELAICMGEQNTIEEALQLFASGAIEQVHGLNQDCVLGFFTERYLLLAITELTLWNLFLSNHMRGVTWSVAWGIV